MSARYGGIPVPREVGLTVAAGEWVAILGPSGAGKTTLLKTIASLLRPTGGSLRYDGAEIGALPAYERVARGIMLVPEGRRHHARGGRSDRHAESRPRRPRLPRPRRARRQERGARELLADPDLAAEYFGRHAR